MSRHIGKTRWKRFLIIFSSGLAVSSVLAISMAQGVLAAAFLVSDQTAKTALGKVIGYGVAQYGFVDTTWSGAKVPVTVVSFRYVKVYDYCQSFTIPLGELGTYTAKLTAGQHGRPVTAENAFIDSTAVSAAHDDYHRTDNGVAAGAVTKGQVNPGDAHSQYFNSGGRAQQASVLTEEGHRSIDVAASAENFSLSDVKFTLKKNGSQCF